MINNCYEIKLLCCHDLKVRDCRPSMDWTWGLLTQLGTTGNYSATASLHITQTTTAPAKPFLACCVFKSRSLATASNSRDS
jgi:hypothetical protein